jgi:5,10-methylenetetrahydromethanopterin reductase
MRWGVWFEPVRPVRELVELAVLAEAEGASVCFVADEGTDRDVWVTLTAIALGTERLVVAPAITNPFSRHPVTSAAAAAALAELAPGRVWHGLGVGGSRVLAPLGLTPAKPFTALRDALETTRSLLAGQDHGPARLDWVDAAPPIPVAVAGRGPVFQSLFAYGV